MNHVRIVRVDNTTPQRWRNGGGWTRELLAWPTPDDWRVRVSVADIETNGPFSPFPDVHRFFAVLDGEGVELTIDGVAQRVTRDGPSVAFPGAATTTCRLLAGPTRDLNLMVRHARGALERVASNRDWQPGAGAHALGCGLFAMAAGNCRSADSVTTVPAGALLWFADVPASLRFDSSGWWLGA